MVFIPLKSGSNLLANDYWSESRQPLASLAFVAPILVVYEAGVVALGPQAIRNGAEVWLRRLLEILDFGQYFLLPGLTVCILLGWHYTTRRPWRLSRGILSRMAVECALLAICLRVILQAEAILLQTFGCFAAIRGMPRPVSDVSGTIGGVLGFLGAGVYEELLFRLILLSIVLWTARRLGSDPWTSVVVAVIGTSIFFSAAHYVGPYGDPIQLGRFIFWFGFLFRFLAGVFFSVLFVGRGFGIAVGAHAGYDILVRLF